MTDYSDETDDGAEDGYLTMTLAKIYIKQQRYEKALEIIRKVNLNNPKKVVTLQTKYDSYKNLLLIRITAKSKQR